MTFKNKASKYLINEHSPGIFSYDEFKDFVKLGGLDGAKKELDKDVSETKSLVNKIGDLWKITLHQKKFFLYYETNYINQTFYTELIKKLQIYGIISTSAYWYEINWKISKTRK